MKEYRSYLVCNCVSEEIHPTHTWRPESSTSNEEFWCWGWTEEDEFFKIIDTEWEGYGE